MGATPNLVRPLFQVNTVDGGTTQQDGQIVGLDDGGYVVIYNDQSPTFTTGQTVVGQRFNASGFRIGGELRVSAFDDGEDSVANGSSVTNLHNGNIAFAYTDVFNGDSNVWVRVLSPALGIVRDDAIDAGTTQTKNASITSFADGSYAVSYTLDNGGGNTDILAKIVSATGVVGVPITVRADGTQENDFSQLATLSNNTFVDVYQRHVGSTQDIYLAIYTSSGMPIIHHDVFGANGLVNETDPDVAALTGGGFVVGWTDAAGDASGQGVRMSIYDNAGSLVAGDIQINTTFGGAQNKVSLVALQDGGFVATWEDDGYAVVRGQRFDATGHQIGGEFVVKDNAHQPGDSHDTALLKDGRFAYALGDSTAGDHDVFTSIWDSRSHTNDFNGDGHSDILLQNINTGAPYVWFTDGTSLVGNGAMVNELGPGWHGTTGGDFNGDNRSDVLWQNTSTGDCVIWEVVGTNVANSSGVGWATGPTWHAAGTGDFNGDGYSDILLQNVNTGDCYIWELNGPNLVGNGFVGWTPGPAWQAKGTGDFNGDGHSDILLQNVTDGTCYIWELNGTSLVGNGFVGWGPGPDWQAKGTGDFNGDARSDILLQNAKTGDCYIWELNGTSLVGNGFVGWTPGPDWQATGTGDFNADGKSDILLQNVTNGVCYLWELNGTSLVGNGFVGWGPGPDWHVV